jgi:hypothetical protein
VFPRGTIVSREILYRQSSRRSLLKGAAAIGLGGMAVATAGYPASAAATLAHPGLLHTQADFNRMAAKVAANAQPWLAGWNRLTANAHSQSTWKANPQATVIRGDVPGQNYGIMYNDIHAAYQNALRWKITGNAANGNAARDILNAWSGTLKTLTGNADRFLAAGIYGYQFANAAEIMRGYSGFDLGRFQAMMLTIFYPMNNQFLTGHNDACITNYWANWDLCNMASVLAIGILCDDQAKVDQAITYFRTGAGNGSINRAVPFLYSGGLGQWQESGRDQGHTMLGIALMGAFCQMAWNQGQDLFSYGGNRFMQGAEYAARYNLGQSVPYTAYTWGTGQNCAQMSQPVISAASRGDNRPAWELLHNHYANLKGLAVPNITAYAARVRAEGGGGDYGPNSGGYDQLGFGTLTYTLETTASTYVRIRNAGTGLFIDGIGRTSNGDNAGQWGDSGGANQQWTIASAGGYLRIRNRATGLYLDGMGRTPNGSAAGQWGDTNSTNQQWTTVSLGGYLRIRNRATGLYLDGMGRTGNGDDLGQWGDTGSTSQQWTTVEAG